MATETNSTLGKVYNYLFHELADPRTTPWPLMENPLPILTIVIIYLYFVRNLGPKLMQNRKPFKLQNTLIVYNFIQVLVSVYLVKEALTHGYIGGNYSWRCEPVDFSYSEHGFTVARGCYFYFLAKISELLDTIFFVLRKKQNQITFLHLYHHSVMPLISWGCTKYYPGGHSVFIGFINSFIHIIMYTYYGLAAMGPEYNKYLWWKKHITTLQMIQFGMCFVHSAQLLFYDCGYPRWSVIFTLPNAIFFYRMFYDFYKQAYKTDEKISNNNEIKNAPTDHKIDKKLDCSEDETDDHFKSKAKLTKVDKEKNI